MVLNITATCALILFVYIQLHPASNLNSFFNSNLLNWNSDDVFIISDKDDDEEMPTPIVENFLENQVLWRSSLSIECLCLFKCEYGAYLSHDKFLMVSNISALQWLNGACSSAAFQFDMESIMNRNLWSCDNLLSFLCLVCLLVEENKDITVADKMNNLSSSSFSSSCRGGVESQQLISFRYYFDTIILSNMDDRWFWDLNGDGVFQVKDVLISMLDRNLSRRNVFACPTLACPLCGSRARRISSIYSSVVLCAKDIQSLTKRDDSQKGMLSKMRVPRRDESFSWGKRRGQSMSVKDAGVISSALSSLQKFSNHGNFLH
ncbi:hypothetical protein Tco_0981737 [Tanacetum coccineum]